MSIIITSGVEEPHRLCNG